MTFDTEQGTVLQVGEATKRFNVAEEVQKDPKTMNRKRYACSREEL